MDKQIEELEKDIAVRMAMAKGVAGSMNKGVEGWLSEYLYNAGYRKIHANEVVVETNVWESLEIKIYRDFIAEEVRKKTAEKFAEKLKKVIHERDYVEGYAFLGICEEIDEICKELMRGDK